MNRHFTPFAAAALVALISGCTSAPQAPTVDDSNKRPVNAAPAVDLMSCKGELSAAKVALFEVTHDESRRVANAAFAANAAANAQCRQAVGLSGAAAGNKVFVVPFKLGSSEFQIGPVEQERFLKEVAKARFILVRARTDAGKDSLAETELAKRRADSALRFILANTQRIPRDGIRLTWQGAGDPLPRGADLSPNTTDRRVEIELYVSLPSFEYLSAGADL